MPNGRQEERRASGDKAEEEDYYERVLVVHEIVAQTGAAVRDAAIGELYVESSKRGGDVDKEEPIEEAYGRVSVMVSIDMIASI